MGKVEEVKVVASHPCLRSRPYPGRHSADSARRRPRRRRRGQQRGLPLGCCTTRRCRHGRVGVLQFAHVFVDGDEVTGFIDWSDACRGDALFDLAILTLGHEAHLDDVVAGYGTDVDVDVIRSWWSLRCLMAVRWLIEHGFGPVEGMPEVAVLRSRS